MRHITDKAWQKDITSAAERSNLSFAQGLGPEIGTKGLGP